MVAVGVTVAVPCVDEHGLHTALPEASVIVNAVGGPPLICHVSVALCPCVIVLGEAERLSVRGTVTVRVCGPALPPGPVAVIEYVIVALTGIVAEPVVGSGPESSPTGGVGVIVTDVALPVAHVSVVVCPALTSVGSALNFVICGGTLAAT